MEDSSTIETRVLEVADRRANRLGFRIEEHERNLNKQNGIYVVKYVPKKPKYKLGGGGVEIWVDSTSLKVIRVLYEQ